MVKKLDQHFSEGHNDQSNEPSHHIPYLYSMIDSPSKTQFHVRNISREAYADTPDGYSGLVLKLRFVDTLFFDIVLRSELFFFSFPSSGTKTVVSNQHGSFSLR